MSLTNSRTIEILLVSAFLQLVLLLNVHFDFCSLLRRGEYLSQIHCLVIACVEVRELVIDKTQTDKFLYKNFEPTTGQQCSNGTSVV